MNRCGLCFTGLAVEQGKELKHLSQKRPPMTQCFHLLQGNATNCLLSASATFLSGDVEQDIAKHTKYTARTCSSPNTVRTGQDQRSQQFGPDPVPVTCRKILSHVPGSIPKLCSTTPTSLGVRVSILMRQHCFHSIYVKGSDPPRFGHDKSFI